MTRILASARALALVLALVLAPVLGGSDALTAQSDDRIWGRVQTVDGPVLEGFLRWDRNEGSWADVLDGSKEIPEENYLAWLAANDEERAMRVVELLGHRVTWEEEHPDFSREATSGIRFGHLAWIEVTGADEARLGLRSGLTLRFEGGGSDIGASMRRLGVEAPGEREVQLRWREIRRVTFSGPPAGARSANRRLFGTVEDASGRRFTGYVAWDADEIFGTDVLDGEEVRGGREHAIPFATLTSIERLPVGARAVLGDGRTLELRGSNDVDDDNRGIQVSDPGLGLVDVPWAAFRSVRFHDPTVAAGYQDFDGGRELVGTVTTRSGEELAGMIRWDADEAFTWELLNGRSSGVAFSVELHHVSRIERGEAFGASVTLADGRSFELDGANDVNRDNKGIMVAPEHASVADPSVWTVVSWDEFANVRFR